MQLLPPEIVQNILQEVDSFHDLTSLCRTCRYLHAYTLPFLYKHTIVDVSAICARGDLLDRSQGPLPPCTALLQGMARNSQGQCQHVRRLDVVDEQNQEGLDLEWINDAYVRQILDERNGMQFFVNCLLETAISSMERLEEFRWMILAYPSNGIMSALSKHNISSFMYRWPEGPPIISSRNTPKIDAPTAHDPDLRLLKQDNLTSLSLYNIGTHHAADYAADMIFSLRNQLKILRLSRAPGWRPGIGFERSSGENSENILRYKRGCIKDAFHPFIYYFIMASDVQLLELEELELLGVCGESFDISNSIRTFNFQSIKRFTLINYGYAWPENENAGDIWIYLKNQKVSFKSIKTDCENEGLGKFLQSFSGVESLLLCNHVKRLLPFSRLELSGHFHSLRQFFYGVNSGGVSSPLSMWRSILHNCPLLEELGAYVDDFEPLEGCFKLLDECPSLRRLYIMRVLVDGHYCLILNHEEFLREFFGYFGPKDSAFFNRLEVLSYYRTLWEIVPTDLDEPENEEMEYELSYEPLEEGELDLLCADQKEDEKDSGMDLDSDSNSDSDPFNWLTEPMCYTWERARSGFSRMPLRASWVPYQDDVMARTVLEYVMGVEENAYLPRREEWADESDAGLDGYATSEED